MSVKITAKALGSMVEFFEKFPESAEIAAVMSINQVGERKAFPMMRKSAYSEVNFRPGYLEAEDRFRIKRKARRGDVEFVMGARDRPTSLAQFVVAEDKRGLSVKVSKRGAAKQMKAFHVNLRRGSTGTLGNKGVAIRIKGGGRPDNAYKPVELETRNGSTVWLLYGPSVDQVMSGVFDENVNDIAGEIDREFTRQFLRIARG